jgi:hypothetical protein
VDRGFNPSEKGNRRAVWIIMVGLLFPFLLHSIEWNPPKRKSVRQKTTPRKTKTDALSSARP